MSELSPVAPQPPSTQEAPAEFTSDHRSQQDGFWAWFEHEAFTRAGLIGGAKGVAVYVALCLLESKAPSKYKAGFAASLNEIATFAQVSKRTAQDTLTILESARLIEVISGRRGAKGEADQANLYRLLPVGFSVKKARRSRGGHSSHCHGPMAPAAIPHGNSEASKFATQERDSSLPLSTLAPKRQGCGEREEGNFTKNARGERQKIDAAASAPDAPAPLASHGQSAAHGTGERGGSLPQTHPGQTHPTAATSLRSWDAFKDECERHFGTAGTLANKPNEARDATEAQTSTPCQSSKVVSQQACQALAIP